MVSSLNLPTLFPPLFFFQSICMASWKWSSLEPCLSTCPPPLFFPFLSFPGRRGSWFDGIMFTLSKNLIVFYRSFPWDPSFFMTIITIVGLWLSCDKFHIALCWKETIVYSFSSPSFFTILFSCIWWSDCFVGLSITPFKKGFFRF